MTDKPLVFIIDQSFLNLNGHKSHLVVLPKQSRLTSPVPCVGEAWLSVIPGEATD